MRSREAIEAILFVRRLWGYLIEDLARPDNDLPQKLRADLISIGLWIMREAEQIRLETSSNFKGLIEVSTAIRDGLSESGHQDRPENQRHASAIHHEQHDRNPQRTTSTAATRRRARIRSTTTRSCSC